MKKNILELCLSPDLGGLELYVFRLTQYLSTKTSVISVLNEDGKLKMDYENAGYHYEKLKRKKVLNVFWEAKKLAGIIDMNDIDVVHIHWGKDIPIAVMAKLLSRKKPRLIQTRHMNMTRFKSDFYHRFLYKHINSIIVVTKQMQEQVERFIPQSIRPKIVMQYIGSDNVIPLAIETRKNLQAKYALQKDDFVVGIVGRIEKAKGQYLLIEAVRQLKEEGIIVKVLIIGHAMDETYLDELKQKVQAYSLESQVIFTGFTNQVQDVMQICDIIVLATEKETFGLVLLEAMHAKVAVVASDCGGPIEIIDHEESGLLFETKNANDLHRKMMFLYENRALKDQYINNAFIKAQKYFSSEKQFEKIYHILTADVEKGK